MPSMTGEPRINAVALWGLLVAVAFIVAVGCAASKISQIEGPKQDLHPVRALIVAPADGLFAHESSMVAYAIGAELAKRGYSVVDTRQATALLAKHNISPADTLTPQGLAALGEGGVDSVLSVSSTGSPIGGSAMRSVTVKVNSTRTAGATGGITWRNAWGGMPGSPADMMMRKGLNEAAQEIAEALAKQLGPAGK